LRYSCQATKLYGATEPLFWWDLRQYVRDVVTRNHSLGWVLRVLWLASLRWLLWRGPFGYRLLRSLHDGTHRFLTGRACPDFEGAIERGQPTPTGRLDLRPGERVRVKSKEEIGRTLDSHCRNRGLSFDFEMTRIAAASSRSEAPSPVTKIIDEATGRMLQCWRVSSVMRSTSRIGSSALGQSRRTGYCLAGASSKAAEYLIYQDAPRGPISVDLSIASRKIQVEWFDPSSGSTTLAASVTGGAARQFTPPFEGDAVLYLYSEHPADW
jgi:hypothetical protein